MDDSEETSGKGTIVLDACLPTLTRTRVPSSKNLPYRRPLLPLLKTDLTPEGHSYRFLRHDVQETYIRIGNRRLGAVLSHTSVFMGDTSF